MEKGGDPSTGWTRPVKHISPFGCGAATLWLNITYCVDSRHPGITPGQYLKMIGGIGVPPGFNRWRLVWILTRVADLL